TLFLFFFFQAEDGIRDRNVTGVQTCALPIYTTTKPINVFIALSSRVPLWLRLLQIPLYRAPDDLSDRGARRLLLAPEGFELVGRSEERRVGKGCRWGVGW